MKKIFLITIVCFSTFISFSQIKELREAQDIRKKYVGKNKSSIRNFSKTNYVNPFIGTGGHGHTYPGASSPFGMMQLSPDTRHEGWDGCSGYHYSDSIIYGFSHTHLSGTGVPDYCDLLIVPQSGKAITTPGYETKEGYGSKFSHEKEEATPGFYSVHLDDENIDVRLTVAERAGYHEYTFNNSKDKKYILIDLDHRDQVLSSSFEVVDGYSIAGSRISSSWASKQEFYFFLKTDIPHKKVKIITKNGKNKMLITFPKETKKINLKVGMSAVDTKGAENNLNKEIPNWNFNSIRAETTRKWNKELDKIYFYTTDQEVMYNFYTAFYHSLLNPNVFTDVDGRYRGMDNKIYQLRDDEERTYTVFSLWDTYRALHPLLTLTHKEKTNEFINTFLRQYEQSGDLPVWELAGNETNCMIGYHSVSVISDAYTKGINAFDIDKTVKAIFQSMAIDKFGKREFFNNGYISTQEEPESVSKTLEYAYDNFCVNQLLNEYKKNSDNKNLSEIQEKIHNSSFNFVNVYDPKAKFMRARNSGQWFAPFDPSEVNFNYTEANSWQYSLYAPHAVGVLTKMLGGKDSLEMWLDRLFTTESNLSGRHQVDITGLIGQYAHGNEPSHHIAYLYNYTNSPEKTQFYIDTILNTMYSNQPDGLSGNEDCGQMSAWYILSAMGIYQIAPGSQYYDIGRPLMDEASIKLDNDNYLNIKTLNNSKKNKYIQKIILNGLPIHRNYIHYSEFSKGGVLEITMGDSPQMKHDKYSSAPTLSELPQTFIPVPHFEQTNRIFEEKMSLSINTVFSEKYTIYYTIDGTDPSTSQTAIKYRTPFTIDTTTIVSAYTVNQYGRSSTVSNEFILKNKNISIDLKSNYDNQYAASGDFTLIDGIRGGNEFRTGDWQGYWAHDVVAEINFDNSISLTEIGIGCLSDMKSWIFFPSEVEIVITFDDLSFESIGKITLEEITASDMFPTHRDFKIKTNTAKEIKKIRVIAKNFGTCPEWHLGNGNDTWLFVDEIFFK